MRLKRVRIFGFKTFADRTEVDLEGGLVAVVGPNGCGKSNLVDAILWGLGEGNARHLRAQTSQDVIFSGSAKRKAVGYAEVTLLFDNEDGSLPLESSEVAITRRLTRGGDSEYSINRQTCRLRDILDLLADSGLGRAGYSIVGQKEIDQALAASAEDRRAWVDEAAGVQRYRARKIESLRRLQAAQGHLDRVNDILGELESQREPLRQEAEVAKRYKSIQASLREVESGLLMVEIATAEAEVEALESKIAETMDLARKELALADEAENEQAAKQARLRELDAELDRVRAKLQAASTAMERADSSVRLAEQKLRTLGDLQSNLGEEAEIAARRIEEAAAELSQLAQEEEGEKVSLDELRENYAGAESAAKELAARLKTLEAELQAAREHEARRLRQLAERSHRTEREQDIRREIQGIDASLPDLESALAEAEQRHQAAKAQVDVAKGQIAELAAQVEQLLAEDREEAQAVRASMAERATLDGRKRGIEATVEAHEGLNQGARAVMDLVGKGLLENAYVPVGEAIEAKREHALAIETALGGAAHDLIVPDESFAKFAIEHLKTDRLGRATFQPISLMRPPTVSPDVRKLLVQPGILGLANDLVECEPLHRPVIDSLLGGVLVVDRLETALRLAKTRGWSRIVTLEGEVVHSGGAVTGGRSGKSSYGLVQRKAELAEVTERLRKLDRELKEAERRAAGRATERQAVEAQIEAAREGLHGTEAGAEEARVWHRSLQEELETTLRSRAKLESERAQLAIVVDQDIPAQDLAGMEARRDDLLRQLAARTSDADQAEERLREAQRRIEQARLRRELAAKRHEAALEAEKTRQRRLANLGPERERAEHEISQGAEQREKARRDHSAAQAELEALQERKSQCGQAIRELGERARQARNSAQTLSQSAHQAELSRARADSRRASALQRLLEEYGLDKDDALRQAPSIELPPDAQPLVARLRRELKAMGDVNLGAVEAFERLTERSDELNAQKEDVLEGIRQVQASIRELDKLTRERFSSTFEAVEAAFQQTFKKLFDGGEGRLFLTDPENLLETGIDIQVQLPGKKSQRLELLSGGERSLCATAFLFALLKAKPSPLVILDEVDAPLDGRNVERYIDLLREFSESIQFILVTHNPTTIEACPVFLGVTMQEPGVSTLVPVHVAAMLPETAAAPG
jgi:chromosome segregation protein